MNPCTAIRANGEPCRARPLPDRLLCWAHDPDHQARAAEARRRGGQNRSTVIRTTSRMPKSMKDLAGRILEAFEQAHHGVLPPDRAHAMARLAAVYVQIHQAGETDARLDALEAAASQRKGWRA